MIFEFVVNATRQGNMLPTDIGWKWFIVTWKL